MREVLVKKKKKGEKKEKKQVPIFSQDVLFNQLLNTTF